jgi:pimeloyl-ACP methyl ester carboxylesterase
VPATTSPQRVNGLNFHVEESGSGEPLVLIHGGWGSTARWALIVDDLAESFHVVNYDRRGHGRSENSDVPPTRLDQEDDVVGIVEALGVGPVHLVGSSFGGAMALSLALRRPDLVRSVCVHEPPLLAYAGDHPDVQHVLDDMNAIAALVRTGQREKAARECVERIMLGPGAWELTPQAVKDSMVAHADAFAGEMLDPNWTIVDDLDQIQAPVLLTCGDQSPAWFAPVIAGLREALPQAEVLTIEGSGHVPHVTHPEEYVEVLTRFASSAPR